MQSVFCTVRASKVTLLAAMSHHPRYLSQTRIASFPMQATTGLVIQLKQSGTQAVQISTPSACGLRQQRSRLAIGEVGCGVSVRMSVHLHLSRNKVTRLDVCMSSLRRGHTGCHNREHICNRICRARAKTKATLRTPILKLSEFKIVDGEFASLVSTCFARQHTDPTFSVGFFLQGTAITPHV